VWSQHQQSSGTPLMADPSPGSLAALHGAVSFDVLHPRRERVSKMKHKVCALQSGRDGLLLQAQTTRGARGSAGPSLGLLSAGPGCASAAPAASQGTLPGCLCHLPDLGGGWGGGIHTGR